MDYGAFWGKHPTLAELTKTQQEYTLEKVEGVLVGIRCPQYAAKFNLPGWHIHFLSAKRDAAGHLLDVSAEELQAILEQKDSFEIILPHSPEFETFDLAKD